MKKISMFSSDSDSRVIRTVVNAIMFWYFIDTFLFLIIGISEASLQTIYASFFLVLWYVLTTLVLILTVKHKFISKNFSKVYSFMILILSIIEESLVYFNGGGLGGTAESLTQDLLLAVPVFLGIALGILVLNHWIPLSNGEIFILAAIQGFLIEIIISGKLLLVWLLGGPALGIYGMMMAAISNRTSKLSKTRDFKSIMIILIVGTILCFVGSVLGAIFGNTIYETIA